MNKKQELIFNKKFTNLLKEIICFKHIFTYACNIYSNIYKININLIMDILYKNNYNYDFKIYFKDKDNYTYNSYDFKYFKLIIILTNNNFYLDLKIKLLNINKNVNYKIIIRLEDNIVFNYIKYYDFKYKIKKNNILYKITKCNHHIYDTIQKIWFDSFQKKNCYLEKEKYNYINGNDICIIKCSDNIYNYSYYQYCFYISYSYKIIKDIYSGNYKEFYFIKNNSKIYYKYSEYNSSRIYDITKKISFISTFYSSNKIKYLIL